MQDPSRDWFLPKFLQFPAYGLKGDESLSRACQSLLELPESASLSSTATHFERYSSYNRVVFLMLVIIYPPFSRFLHSIQVCSFLLLCLIEQLIHKEMSSAPIFPLICPCAEIDLNIKLLLKGSLHSRVEFRCLFHICAR